MEEQKLNDFLADFKSEDLSKPVTIEDQISLYGDWVKDYYDYTNNSWVWEGVDVFGDRETFLEKEGKFQEFLNKTNEFRNNLLSQLPS